VPLDLQEGLAAGQHIRVHEEITSSAALEKVEWRRAAPGTLDALDSDPSNLPALGQRQAGPPGVTVHRTPVLAAGTHVHEYVLVAVRPGTCRLPPPQVLAGGQAVDLSVEPEELGVLVRGD
jgi:hypothetical protein